MASLNKYHATEVSDADSKSARLMDEWTGCYPSNWKGVIVPEAMVHPAKFSSKLIRRIYEHMLGEGWLKPGDLVLDPFGGVALGALDAMRLGLRWRGVELEAKFAELGNQNIAAWNARFASMPRWCADAVLLRGDSRKLLEVLHHEGHEEHKGVQKPGGPNSQSRRDTRYQVAGAVSSPPYADGAQHTGGDDPHPEKMQGGKYQMPGLSGAVSSPPYSEARIGQESGQGQCGRGDQYGESRGQLGAMKAGNFESVVDSCQCSVTSPPFRQSGGGTGEKAIPSKYRKDPTFMARHAAGNAAAEGYGATEGQLANMGEGSFDEAVDGRWLTADGVVSSPAYENSSVVGGEQGKNAKRFRLNEGDTYGYSEGQLGQESGNDFWLAARQIVEQVYLALEPGGHAVWVVKDFVKNKERVPFCDQWRRLFEAVGFVTVHEHQAMQVHHRGTSITLEGQYTENVTESKSFFRRLAERKAAARRMWEKVVPDEDKAKWLLKAKDFKWQEYNALLDAEKQKKNEKGKLIHPAPTEKKILEKAQMMVLDWSFENGISIKEFNAETRIDYEVVLCMEKPSNHDGKESTYHLGHEEHEVKHERTNERTNERISVISSLPSPYSLPNSGGGSPAHSQ